MEAFNRKTLIFWNSGRWRSWVLTALCEVHGCRSARVHSQVSQHELMAAGSRSCQPSSQVLLLGKWVTAASLPLFSVGNGLVRKGDHGQLLFGSLQTGQRAARRSGRCITVKRLTSYICIPSLNHSCIIMRALSSTRGSDGPPASEACSFKCYLLST